MGEWVRWKIGLTWGKINPDGKKRTKIEKRTQVGKVNTDKKKMNPDRKK